VVYTAEVVKVNLADIPDVIKILAGTGLLLAFTLLIMSEVENQTTGDANTAIGAFIDALADFADWQDTIVIVVIGVILLGMVVWFTGKK